LQAYGTGQKGILWLLVSGFDTINLDYTQHSTINSMHELVWGTGYNLEIEDDINTDITQIMGHPKPIKYSALFAG